MYSTGKSLAYKRDIGESNPSSGGWQPPAYTSKLISRKVAFVSRFHLSATFQHIPINYSGISGWQPTIPHLLSILDFLFAVKGHNQKYKGKFFRYQQRWVANHFLSLLALPRIITNPFELYFWLHPLLGVRVLLPSREGIVLLLWFALRASPWQSRGCVPRVWHFLSIP